MNKEVSNMFSMRSIKSQILLLNLASEHLYSTH